MSDVTLTPTQQRNALDILRQINAELDELAVRIERCIKEKQDETPSDEN